MRRAPDFLDTLTVASPCPASWDAMEGDDRVRYCPRCRQNVYNLIAMSPRAAEELVRASEGRLCGRLYRRADGTVTPGDCSAALAAARRVWYWVGALAAALLVGVLGVAAAVLSARGREGEGRPNQGGPFQAVFEFFGHAPDGGGDIIMGGLCPPRRAAGPSGRPAGRLMRKPGPR